MSEGIEKLKNLKPTQTIVISFLLVIFLGALLLSLPISSQDGVFTPYVDALFTSTSAVCITGLATVNTLHHWSVFGQVVIMVLIQIGGLGFMTLVTVVFMFLGKKITLKERVLIQESFNLAQNHGLVAFVRYIFLMTISIESVGALLLSIRFIPEYGLANGIFKSVFHSVSAFCNAGFDIIGYNSMAEYSNDWWVNIVLILLIVIGGLGFTVCQEIFRTLLDVKNKKFSFIMGLKRLSLHSKLVLTVTGILIISGWIAFFALEYNNPFTMGGFSLGHKTIASLFQSVTLRTAGFSSINQGEMTYASKFLSVILMMIGGSPAGTAGGIKTVTLGVIIISIISVIKGSDSINAFSRSISIYTLQKALSIVMLLLSFLLFGTMVLSCTEAGMMKNFEFLDLLFEVASALGTVGLSTGITEFLTVQAKLLISLFMFIGRLGPITIAVALASKQNSSKNLLHYPEEKILVG